VKVRRVIVVLSTTPDGFDEEYFYANKVRESYEPDLDDIDWEVLDDIAQIEDLNVGAADQLSAHKRDSGPNSCYLVVRMKSL
jgi:hypothetical protein